MNCGGIIFAKKERGVELCMLMAILRKRKDFPPTMKCCFFLFASNYIKSAKCLLLEKIITWSSLKIFVNRRALASR